MRDVFLTLETGAARHGVERTYTAAYSVIRADAMQLDRA
jgi:hypothetical protein